MQLTGVDLAPAGYVPIFDHLFGDMNILAFIDPPRKEQPAEHYRQHSKDYRESDIKTLARALNIFPKRKSCCDRAYKGQDGIEHILHKNHLQKRLPYEGRDLRTINAGNLSVQPDAFSTAYLT